MPTDSPKNLRLDRRADEIAGRAPANSNDLLTTCEVSEWLGVSVSWLEIARHKDYGPPFTRISYRAVRYHREDVLAWLKDRKHHSTAEYMARGE